MVKASFKRVGQLSRAQARHKTMTDTLEREPKNKEGLDFFESRLSAAVPGERWWTSDETDRWTAALFGSKATFTDWGSVVEALTSIDAAVALIMRLKPEAEIELTALRRGAGVKPSSAKLWSTKPSIQFGEPRPLGFARADTAPIALLLALVRSLKCEPEKNKSTLSPLDNTP
jgi:hypothetical protein